jgi:hypothetical protein
MSHTVTDEVTEGWRKLLNEELHDFFRQHLLSGSSNKKQ